jgi:RecA-family ATPase
MELLVNSNDPQDRDKALQFLYKQYTKQNVKKDNKTVSWQRKTAAQIMSTDYPPLKWAVDGIICEGLTKIDGAPKCGKSWLALHLATCVSFGGCFMGSISVDKKSVLYLALEDNERRIKDHIIKQGGLANNDLFIETPESWKGGVFALRNYLE